MDIEYVKESMELAPLEPLVMVTIPAEPDFICFASVADHYVRAGYKVRGLL